MHKYPRFWALAGWRDDTAGSKTPFPATTPIPRTAGLRPFPRHPSRRSYSAENTDSPRLSHPRDSEKRSTRSTGESVSPPREFAFHGIQSRDYSNRPRDAEERPRVCSALDTLPRLSPVPRFHHWIQDSPRLPRWRQNFVLAVLAATLAAIQAVILEAILAANWKTRIRWNSAAILEGIEKRSEIPAVLTHSEIPAVLDWPALPTPAVTGRKRESWKPEIWIRFLPAGKRHFVE